MTRDRAGHRGPRPWALLIAILLAATAAEAAGDYKARRFDVVARAVQGDLDVTESVTFEFQSGTFKYVFREIPAGRTDGIQIVDAAMDGHPFVPGDGLGQFKVTGRNRVRVEWRFAETGPSTHRFDLHYIARGVAYRDGSDDVVRWRALPPEHHYRIDASRIVFEPAGARVLPLETHNVAAVTVTPSTEVVTIDASGLKANGWIIAELHYPAGTLTTAQPQWRLRDAQAIDMAPKWAIGAGGLFVLGLLVVMSLRRGFNSPETFPNETTTTEPPQPLPAGLASVLVAKGRLANSQGVSTLLDLADRGVLQIREVPGPLGTRAYDLSQVPGAHDLQPHEVEALTIAFGGESKDVSLTRARGRLGRHNRRFNDAMNADLAALGFLDQDRKTARDRVMVAGIVMLLTSALGSVAVAPFIPQYQGWPFLLPLGLGVAGLIGVIVAALMTPLSDAGLIEAARWRGFKRYLKTLATSDDETMTAVPSRWIVYAIASGLGYYWWRYLKRHPGVTPPPWFLATGGDGGAAFTAFVGSNAASGGGGGAGGGAAGGGASGAG